MVGLCRCVAKGDEHPTEVDVPDTASLFGAVDPLLEPKDMAIGDIKTRGHLHIDFLVEVGVEIGGLDIHLVNFQVVFSSKGKYSIE